MEDNNIKQNQQSNFLMYILLFCIVLFMGAFGVILAQYEVISKDEFKNDYVKKTQISFESLPSYIQDEYVEKYKCETKEVIKTVEVEKIVTLTNNIEVEKVINEDIFAKSNYKVAKCYDMKSGTQWLSAKCEKIVSKFLQQNKNAKYFEVIGVVSKRDFLLLEKLKKNQDVLSKLNIGDKTIERLENYAVVGLSKKRVEETSWFIKETLGMETKVLPVNYHILSKKNNQGTVVRVYY